LRWYVLEGLEIKRPEFTLAITLNLLVKALSDFLPQFPCCHQFLGEIVLAVNFTTLVVGNGIVQVTGDVGHHVNADLIEQSEASSVGTPDQWAGERIDLFYLITMLQGVIEQDLPGVYKDSVADEVRTIFAHDHPFAQTFFGKPAESGYDNLVGIITGNDLEQAQIARRIEEVAPEEVAAKCFAASFCNDTNRNARGIRGDNSGWFAYRFETGHEGLLGADLLDNRFNDPITFGQSMKIVLGIT
jgi:hypothetical protein